MKIKVNKELAEKLNLEEGQEIQLKEAKNKEMTIIVDNINKTATKHYSEAFPGSDEKTVVTIDEYDVGTYSSYNDMIKELNKKYDFPLTGWETEYEGWLTTNRMENAKGYEMNTRELEDWQNEKIDGYIADFTIMLKVAIAKAPSEREMSAMWPVK